MMTTSMVNLLQAKHTDELTTALEALPSYENLSENPDESAVFDDENEPSTGLINLIRKNSMRPSQIEVTNDLANLVRIILT